MTDRPGAGATATLSRTLEIEGMHCASCVARVEKALAEVPGVQSASVNLATERAEVVAAPGVAVTALEEAVRGAGYAARAPTGEAELAGAPAGAPATGDRRARRRAALRLRQAQLAIGAVLSTAILVLAYGFPSAAWSNPIQLVLALPVFLWVGAAVPSRRAPGAAPRRHHHGHAGLGGRDHRLRLLGGGHPRASAPRAGRPTSTWRR